MLRRGRGYPEAGSTAGLTGGLTGGLTASHGGPTGRPGGWPTFLPPTGLLSGGPTGLSDGWPVALSVLHSGGAAEMVPVTANAATAGTVTTAASDTAITDNLRLMRASPYRPPVRM